MGWARIDRIARAGGALVAADGRTIATHAHVADGPLARLVGMLGTPDPGVDEALVLIPCSAVHGVGMRAAIGAAFIDGRGVVMAVVDPLPMRGAVCRGARAVIEAASGVLAVTPGDRLALTRAHLFPHGGTFAPRRGGSIATPHALSGHRGRRAPSDDRST